MLFNVSRNILGLPMLSHFHMHARLIAFWVRATKFIGKNLEAQRQGLADCAAKQRVIQIVTLGRIPGVKVSDTADRCFSKGLKTDVAIARGPQSRLL